MITISINKRSKTKIPLRRFANTIVFLNIDVCKNKVLTVTFKNPNNLVDHWSVSESKNCKSIQKKYTK